MLLPLGRGEPQYLSRELGSLVLEEHVTQGEERHHRQERDGVHAAQRARIAVYNQVLAAQHHAIVIVRIKGKERRNVKEIYGSCGGYRGRRWCRRRAG